jgi:transposase
MKKTWAQYFRKIGSPFHLAPSTEKGVKLKSEKFRKRDGIRLVSLDSAFLLPDAWGNGKAYT